MASRNASFHEVGLAGALFAPIKFAFTFTMVFVAILLFAWIVDWIFVFEVWPDGIERLKSILAVDLARGIELAAQQGVAPGGISATANLLFGAVFRATGVYDMGMRFAEGTSLSIPDTIVRNTYIVNREAIEVAMIGTQLLGVRLATLALMAPFIALVYLVAAADGLTQRAIRRASGGRESASLYHRAKHLQIALMAIGLLIGLLWAGTVDVGWMGPTLTAMFGILVRLQWAYYKKHL